MALALTAAPIGAVINSWGSGLWSLHQFAMQMALILLTGHVLAQSKFSQRVFTLLLAPVTSEVRAIFVLSILSMIACWLNWGFGLIAGAFLAIELAKKFPKLSFPVLLATSYSGFLVWHGGLSGSIPLQLASPSSQMQAWIGVESIGVGESIFSHFNLALSIAHFIYIPILNVILYRLFNRSEYSYSQGNLEIEKEVATNFAQRLESSFVLAVLLSSMGLVYITQHFYGGGSLDLNIMIGLFLFMGLLAHGGIFQYTKAFERAMFAASGIILLFPFYSAIMGMMKGTGLAELISQWFVQMSSRETLPLFTYLSAGLINFFVPSGGGQWAIQGPIFMPVAKELGVSTSAVAMSIAWGDAWTNMLQPFWAIPLLTMAKMELKHIVPMCFCHFICSGLISLIFIYICF